MAESITPIILKKHAILTTNIGKIKLPVLFINCTRDEYNHGDYILNSLRYFNIEGSMFSGCDFSDTTVVTDANRVDDINVYITNKSGHTLGLISYGGWVCFAIDGVYQGNNAPICSYSRPNPQSNAHTGGCGIALFNDDKVTWWQGSLAYCNTSAEGFSFILPETNAEFGYYVIDDYRSMSPSLFAGSGQPAIKMMEFLDDLDIPLVAPDPYEDGGESDTAGGEGDFDGTSDPIDFPSLPAISTADTGFIQLFNPTNSQLRDLATYMWSNPLFDLNAWKKIFADPMQAILGLSIVPVHVPDGGLSVITIGNISTDVTMTKAAAQYVEVDCGSLNVNEYWGAYLDYDPYTKAEIYLPYIGTHPLAVDDIMSKAVHVKYHIDILSGACCAYVKCGDSVLYSFVGQCASSIPITGDNWTNVINGALSIAAAVGSMVATGGSSAPMAAGTIASTVVNNFKPSIEKSGSMSGTGGFLGAQKPYIILTRPRQALPKDQNKFIGYPSFITSELSKLSGYTEIESIHLENIPATRQEIAEIETLLKSGVIF